MPFRGAARPPAFEEPDDGGGPAAEFAQGLAVPRLDRRRAAQPLGGKMFHQPQEEGQVLAVHALFIEGQDVAAPGRVHEVVGILDALGDALAGDDLADVIGLDEGSKVAIRHFGVNSHVEDPV